MAVNVCIYRLLCLCAFYTIFVFILELLVEPLFLFSELNVGCNRLMNLLLMSNFSNTTYFTHIQP